MSSSDHDPTPPLSNTPSDRSTTDEDDEDVVSETTDTPECKNMAVQTSSSDIIPHSGSKQSTWTCRLPSELMGLVLECLVEDEALGTLAQAQSTSRAMYSLTTPYLYRDIIVHQHQAFALFGLFDTYPREDNTMFIGPIPNHHPIDLHLTHRLRYLFSHTQTLVFRAEYRPDFKLSNTRSEDSLSTQRSRRLIKRIKSADIVAKNETVYGGSEHAVRPPYRPTSTWQ